MNASVGDTFDPERTLPNPESGMATWRDRPAARPPVIAHCLRAAPRSPLPSDFERAVIDAAAHARYAGRCERVLRRECRRCVIAGVSLLAIAAALALYLPTPWLAAVPIGLAVGVAWRWAVVSAAADEIRAEAAG